MRRITMAIRLAAAIAVFGGAGAFAMNATPAEFVSPSGYRITAPEGWEVAPDDLIATATAQAHRTSGALRSRPGASAVDLILIDPSATGFMSNLTITVVDAPLSVTPEALAAHRRDLVRKAAQAGAEMEILSAEIADLGPARGFSVMQRTRYPEMQQELRQWMAAIPAGSRTLHVTGTTSEEAFGAVEPLLRKTVASIRIETSAAERWHRLPFKWKASAALGLAALAAGVAAAWKRLRRPKRREDAPTAVED